MLTIISVDVFGFKKMQIKMVWFEDSHFAANYPVLLTEPIIYRSNLPKYWLRPSAIHL